ncbi:PREDICTED: EMI domain-containing protein 1-like [Nipponia nippon]|uniref:EMI domain-containing protein 1-like n=1 Tax=Nipponia nippon TaxID=128390 RepID=UPI000510844C|nr:PREDICTED: EMI domain-containing protein 1-like [Nipponia nippon]
MGEREGMGGNGGATAGTRDGDRDGVRGTPEPPGMGTGMVEEPGMGTGMMTTREEGHQGHRGAGTGILEPLGHQDHLGWGQGPAGPPGTGRLVAAGPPGPPGPGTGSRRRGHHPSLIAGFRGDPGVRGPALTFVTLKPKGDPGRPDAPTPPRVRVTP